MTGAAPAAGALRRLETGTIAAGQLADLVSPVASLTKGWAI